MLDNVKFVLSNVLLALAIIAPFCLLMVGGALIFG